MVHKVEAAWTTGPYWCWSYITLFLTVKHMQTQKHTLHGRVIALEVNGTFS